MGLIKGRHSVDVSRPLAANQQPLQILRITHWLTAYFIGHNDTPPGGNPIKLRHYLTFAILDNFRFGDHVTPLGESLSETRERFLIGVPTKVPTVEGKKEIWDIETATGHHSPGGATPPGTSGGSFSTISSERPNSSMRDVLRSASVGSVFVSVPSAATRNLLLRPMVRIACRKWRQIKMESLKNPTVFVL